MFLIEDDALLAMLIIPAVLTITIFYPLLVLWA